MIQIPRKNCIVCQKEIYRKHSVNKEKRSINSITCSRSCSLTYQRVRAYLKWKEKSKVVKC